MAAIISDAYRVNATRSMLRCLDNPESSYYLFLGKASRWENDNDRPIPPTLALNEEHKVSKEMIYAIKLTGANASLAINRYDWMPNTIYSQYDTKDGDINDLGNVYYIVNEDFNIYKCLSNYNGAVSTHQPKGTSTEPFMMPDGYIWRYMASVGPSDQRNFTNSQFVPVTNVAVEGSPQWAVQSAAIHGSIESYIIRNGGAGYSYAEIQVEGDGQGATATTMVKAGKIDRIVMNNKGRGYTWARAIISGDGQGAVIDPQVSPRGGHGSDIETELGAFYLMMQSEVSYPESAIVPSSYQYRKVGIIKDPKTESGLYQEYDISGCCKMYGSTSGFDRGDQIDFINDSEYVGSALVLDLKEDSSGQYFLLSDLDNYDAITPSLTKYAKTVDNVVNSQVVSIERNNIIPSSAELMFVEHRTFVTKDDQQIEHIKLVVEF